MLRIHALFLLFIIFSINAVYSATTPPGINPPKITYNLDQGTGSVEFNAIGRPSALKIHGKGAHPQGTLTFSGTSITGTATFDLSSLDTGINMRNEHMKNKYLEVGKYPQSKFTFTKITLPDSFKGSTDQSISNVPFEGTLNLHGVDQPIKGTAKVEKKSGQLSFVGDFSIVIDDYKIPTPGFAGITMASKVDVEVTFNAQPVAVKK